MVGIDGTHRRLKPTVNKVSPLAGLFKDKNMINKRTLFPLFIDINGKKVMVIGGGNVAERRLKALVLFGADITVISPSVTEYIENTVSSNTISIKLLKRKYQHGDIAAVNPFLIIAATNDRLVNHDIMTEAKRQNIYISVADCRDECTFYFPAIAESDEYIAGLVSKDGNHTGVKQTAERIRRVINTNE